MENVFIVNGGKPLVGTVTVSGAKNVALKIIIASLFFDEEIILENVPRIGDIEELLHLIRGLGVTAEFIDHNTLKVDPRTLSKNTVDLLHGSKIRVSFMLFAPLLYVFKEAVIPNPGGCRLGARPIDRHIEMMKSFGARVDYDSSTGFYKAVIVPKKGSVGQYRFKKKSHTGTELAILFGIFAERPMVIENAAEEPEVNDLIDFLNTSGCRIVRSSSQISIYPHNRLKLENKRYRIPSDRNEAVTYAIFAIATGGNITVHGIARSDIEYFLAALSAVSGGFEILPDAIRFFSTGELKKSDITTTPHPGFMTDWQGPWAVLMTQAKGVSTIHETVFENRFGYVAELKKLGANIESFQPDGINNQETYQFNIESQDDIKKLRQAIKIYGNSKLHNGVLQVTDLRAGASLLIAAAVAEGTSVIEGASIIERGYESIVKKLKAVSADIKKI